MTHYQSPDWRQPKSKSEADSLVLDILTYLDTTQPLSKDRDKALTAALHIVLYGYPKNITYQQAIAILNTIVLYGDELARPTCTVLRCFSPKPDFEALADGFLKAHCANDKPQSEVVQDIKKQFTKIVADTIEEHNGVGRSIVVWRNHKLYYLYPGGFLTEIQKPAISVTEYELTPEQRAALTISGTFPSFSPMPPEKSYRTTNTVVWICITFFMLIWTIFCVAAIVKGQ